MGLYLCIFDGEEEVDGVEIGSYADYNALRDYVVQRLETSDAGSKYPTYVLHSDCDGEWSPADCQKLIGELAEIAEKLKELPAINFNSAWQRTVADSIGLVPQNAFESFIDVDGEFLIDRLKNLAERAITRQVPILFQ